MKILKLTLIPLIILLAGCGTYQSTTPKHDFFGIKVKTDSADAFIMIAGANGWSYSNTKNLTDPNIYAYADINHSRIDIKVHNAGAKPITSNYFLDDFSILSKSGKTYVLEKPSITSYPNRDVINPDSSICYSLRQPFNKFDKDDIEIIFVKLGWNTKIMLKRIPKNLRDSTLCSSYADSKISLFSPKFWETASVEDVSSAVAHGADVNTKNEDGVTALMIAAFWSTNPDIIERLVKLDADVNARSEAGVTALMSAAMGNTNPDVIERLVKLGADVNARNKTGTALMAAVMMNTNPDVIERLLKLGADISCKEMSGNIMDLAKENESLKGTKAYWMLSDAMSLAPQRLSD